MARDILLVGASTRAAAHSALRAGWKPTCVDMFGDVDLVSVAQVATVADFPSGLSAAALARPPCPWMYTGGLENHPQIIARIAEIRPLFGNGTEALACVRDPWRLAACLSAAGLPALEILPKGTDIPPVDGAWLRKPLGGAGGRGICVWNAVIDAAIEPCYFQRRASGTPYSAQFLAYPDRTVLLGVARQLIGLTEVGAAPFAWCGAVTPAALAQSVLETMRRIGEAISRDAGLRGLFGCDFVVEQDTPRLTEVNPRYTAAMELLDHQHRTSMVSLHVEACASGGRNANFGLRISDCGSAAQKVIGKLVLFADRDLVTGDATGLLRNPCSGRLPFVADLPAPGQPIPTGQPVCSLFAYGRTEEACIDRLLRRARWFRRRYLR